MKRSVSVGIGAANASLRSAASSRTSLTMRVVPDAPRMLGPLEAALGGAGRPAGIAHTARVGDAIELTCESATPLAVVVALVDAVLARAPGRRIELASPLDDEALAAFAGAMLGEPELDASRLIETHLEPLLARDAP